MAVLSGVVTSERGTAVSGGDLNDFYLSLTTIDILGLLKFYTVAQIY